MRQPLKGILALIGGFVLASVVAAAAQFVSPVLFGVELPPALIGVIHLAVWGFFGFALSGARLGDPANPVVDDSVTTSAPVSIPVDETPTPIPDLGGAEPSSATDLAPARTPEPRMKQRIGGPSRTIAYAIGVIALSFSGGYLGARYALTTEGPQDIGEIEQPTIAEMKAAAEDRLANPAWAADVVRDMRLLGLNADHPSSDSLRLYFDTALELCHQALDGQSVLDHITETVEPMAEGNAELDAGFTRLYIFIWSATEDICMQPPETQ